MNRLAAKLGAGGAGEEMRNSPIPGASGDGRRRIFLCHTSILMVKALIVVCLLLLSRHVSRGKEIGASAQPVVLDESAGPIVVRSAVGVLSLTMEITQAQVKYPDSSVFVFTLAGIYEPGTRVYWWYVGRPAKRQPLSTITTAYLRDLVVISLPEKMVAFWGMSAHLDFRESAERFDSAAAAKKEKLRWLAALKSPYDADLVFRSVPVQSRLGGDFCRDPMDASASAILKCFDIADATFSDGRWAVRLRSVTSREATVYLDSAFNVLDVVRAEKKNE